MAKKKEPAVAAAAPSQAPEKEIVRKRKTYELPGQIHDPPEETEPLRIFYESLLNQRPDSEMAQIWMMENGLLDEEEAARVLQIKQRRSKGGSFVSAPPRPISSGKPAAKAAGKLVPLGKAAAKAGGKAAAATKATAPVGRTASGGKGGVAKGGAGSRGGGGGSGGGQGKGPAKRAAKAAPNSDDDDLPLTRIKKK